MSDILIRGMEMPESCYKCPVRRRDGMDIVCPIAHERFPVADVNILVCRLDNCPLVPVPPHGRLIDADKLDIYRREEQAWIDYNLDHHNEYLEGVKDGLHEAAKQLSTAPTVIEAEEGE